MQRRCLQMDEAAVTSVVAVITTQRHALQLHCMLLTVLRTPITWPAAAVMSRPLAEACNDRVISVILG